jgi:hypothetical protein
MRPRGWLPRPTRKNSAQKSINFLEMTSPNWLDFAAKNIVHSVLRETRQVGFSFRGLLLAVAPLVIVVFCHTSGKRLINLISLNTDVRKLFANQNSYRWYYGSWHGGGFASLLVIWDCSTICNFLFLNLYFIFF